MDIAFSQTLPCRTTALATRTIPLGEFWMTSGAALPIDAETDIVAALRRVESDRGESLDSEAIIALSIVRACLAAGAADHIVYAPPQAVAAKPKRKRRWPGNQGRRR